MGMITCAIITARDCATRLSCALSWYSSRLTSSRPASCTVRTPLIASAMAPLAMDEASRARRKVRRACGSHTMRTMISVGTTARAISPSIQSMATSTVMMPISSSMSPTANTEDSRNSCSAYTSPCRRDISRPVSVRSMKDSDTRCRWRYMARRRSNSTRAPARATTPSCSTLATKFTRMMPTKTATAARSSVRAESPAPATCSNVLLTISGIASCVAVNTSTAASPNSSRRR